MLFPDVRTLLSIVITLLFVISACAYIGYPNYINILTYLFALYAAAIFIVNGARYIIHILSRGRCYLGECRVYDGMIVVCTGRLMQGCTGMVFFRLIPTQSFTHVSEREFQQYFNAIKSLYTVPQFGGLAILTYVAQPPYITTVEQLLRQALGMKLLLSKGVKEMLKEELELLKRQPITYGLMLAIAFVQGRDANQVVTTAKTIIPSIRGMFQVAHVKCEPIRVPELIDVLNTLMLPKFYKFTL